ncbi:uncharacterized protein LOC142996515 [Genypterus blacodes]|uniref:uncharacterized protein LOC142996515 n=1 Tax=Genypterus blacodes TaxID=154954 RepID=UPI003F77573B
MEITKVSNSAKRSADVSPELLVPGAGPPGNKAANSVSSSHLQGDLTPKPNLGSALEEITSASTHPTDTPAVSPETQQSVLDACPHDVLYISDLITFSSRFCGSNRPPSSQLVFGSDQEMVEVIMELITTTHWGRGFALLFHYHNLTEPGGDRRASAPEPTKVDSLLAAVSGAAFFAMILTSTLCVIFRPKLCPKRSGSCTTSNSEVPEGNQSAQAEVSELQLVSAQCTNTETSLPYTVSAHGGMSQNAELELSSSGLTELDLGADEVFIVTPAPSTPGLSICPHTLLGHDLQSSTCPRLVFKQQELFLRLSDTDRSPAGDWTLPIPTSASTEARSAKDAGGGCTRPRAWSVRTFQDFLPPIPQLHKKWCSWNSTSPFTKLVDSAPSGQGSECHGQDRRKVLSDVHLEATEDTSTISDSSISNASYPLTQPAQRQRRLNSTSNLRRSRFTGPCFGLLSEPTDPTKTSAAPHVNGSPSEASSGSPSPSGQSQPERGQEGKGCEFPGEGDHVSVQVFAISEEEDRQPLVPAEHLDQVSAVVNGLVGTHGGLKLALGDMGLSPQSQRARAEKRPWGSQASGGVGPLTLSSPGTMVSNPARTSVGEAQPPLSQPTLLCSATNQM